MLIPIRCLTCGTLIADKYQKYQQRVSIGESPEDVLNDLNVKRYCCRRMFISTVETIYQILPYYETLSKRREEMQTE